MITVIFLGALHDDPNGKLRLQRFIRTLESERGKAPQLIAFEWAEPTYSALSKARTDFGILLDAEFSAVAQGIRKRISATLGYEGDFRDNTAAKKVWMLNGWPRADINISESDRDLVRVASAVKITNLKTWLFPKIDAYHDMEEGALETAIASIYLEESRRLSELYEGATPSEIMNSIDTGRECFMFHCLLRNLREFQTGDGYAVVLVGAAHLLDAPDTLFNLCKVRGFAVERFWPHQQ